MFSRKWEKLLWEQNILVIRVFFVFAESIDAPTAHVTTGRAKRRNSDIASPQRDYLEDALILE